MMDSVKDLTQAKEIAEHVCRMLTNQMRMPDFNVEGGVPMEVAMKVIGKDACYIRQGIEDGWLPIGAVKPAEGSGGRRNFYISPKLFWEYTGYVWTGEKGDKHA